MFRGELGELRTFSKRCFFTGLPLLFLFVASCLVFINPHAEAADSGDALLKGLTSSLHLTLSRQVDQTKNISVEPQKVYSEEVRSTAHVRVSVSDTMKLFFNLQPTSKDYYDRRNNMNKACTMFGLDILF